MKWYDRVTSKPEILTGSKPNPWKQQYQKISGTSLGVTRDQSETKQEIQTASARVVVLSSTHTHAKS
jgi:hypothetical protein